MKRQRWFLVGLMMVLVFSWASGAVASSVMFDFYSFGLNNRVEMRTRTEWIQGGSFMLWEFLEYSPTKAGPFSLQDSCSSTISAGRSSFPPGGTIIDTWYQTLKPGDWLYHSSTLGYWVSLDQTGPLRFADLFWEVTILKEGTETSICSRSADAEFISSGGYMDEGVSFDYGNITIPMVSYYAEGLYPWWDPGIYSSGSTTVDLTFTISVKGNVVPVPGPFADLILSFFDTAVSDNILTGNGRGKSAEGRLDALRNMIEIAIDLIAAGNMEEAYQQLNDIYKKIDGDPLIPDFVGGEAAADLAQMILDLENSLDQTTSLALSTSDTFHTPLPPSFWLLGSGLLGLVGWRKIRKG